MNPKEITIVRRMTPEEVYKRDLGIDSLDDLAKQGVSLKDIKIKKEKTEAQTAFLEELKKEYGFEKVVSEYELEDLAGDKIKKVKTSKALIAFGGDSTLVLTGHFAGRVPVIGLRGDDRSVGAMMYYNRSNFRQAMEKILQDKYETEEWTRLKAEINGDPFAPAISQYNITATFSETYMSKLELEINGVKEKSDSSGIIITTGAGSRGQGRSTTWYLGDRYQPFFPTEKKAIYVMSEPSSPWMHWSKKYSLPYGELKQGDELTIHSKCKIRSKLLRELKLNPGHICADALEHFFAKEGTEIKIKIDTENPLHVISVPRIAYKRW